MSLCLKSRFRRAVSSRRFGALAVTAVTVLATIAVPGLVEPAGATSRGTYLGIDVAAHQHPGDKPIDWKAVRRSGVRFAFIKATEGAGRPGTVSTNPWFGKDWTAAGAAGIVRGAYHYARPRYPLSTATSDAQRFMSVVHQAGRGELAPVLDLEETGGLNPSALASWVDAWLRETSSLAGRPAIIYTTRGFWTSYVSDTTKFVRYPLWMANHTTAARPVPLPGGWAAWSYWQYNDNGQVAGISAPVDLDWSCGWPGSAPSASKGSVCATTGTAPSSGAGATVKASTSSPVKKSTTTSTTKTKSSSSPSTGKTSSSSSNKKTSSSSSSTKKTPAAAAAAPAPQPAAPPPPKPKPKPGHVM